MPRGEEKTYKVVVNTEGQYSIWPAEKDNPIGWQEVGKAATKSECLESIKELWTDMRPISLRRHMDATQGGRADSLVER